MSPDHLDVIKDLRKRDALESDEPIKSSNGHDKEEAIQVKTLILDETKSPVGSSIKIDECLKNAYRILGLSARASQAEIHEANSSIRRTLKIGVDKTTPWDLPWLGPLSRTEKDLQAATGRLTNPAQRLQERLFWFSDNTTLLNEATIESLSTVISELKGEANSHDLALLKLTYANLTDPELKNKSLWIETINLWQNVVDSDDYWAFLLDLEMDGEFEPFATIEEVESLKFNVNRLVCSKLLALANEGVFTKNDDICRQVFSILRDSKLPRNTFYDFETQVLGGLEDEFTQLCERIRSNSSNSLNKQDTNAPDNIKACTTALNRFNNEIQPFLNRLLNLSGHNTEFANRVKEEAASCLRGIAIDFTWADEFIRSQELLERARNIAPKDSSIYHRILEDLGDVEKTSEKQKIWKDLQPIKSAPTLQTINGVGFTLYGCTDTDPETKSYLTTYYFVFFFIPIFPICRYRVISAGDRSYKFLGKAPLRPGDKWHLGIAVALIIICFFAMAFGSNSNGSSYSTYSASNNTYQQTEPSTGSYTSEALPYSQNSSETSSTDTTFTPYEMYISGNDVNIRTSPNATSPILTTMALGDKVEVSEQNGDWLKIAVYSPRNIDYGWVNASLLKTKDQLVQDLHSKIQAEISQLESYKKDFEEAKFNYNQIKSQLELARSNVDSLEITARYSGDTTAYQNALNEYNELVPRHNDLLRKANEIAQNHDSLLEEINKQKQIYEQLSNQ